MEKMGGGEDDYGLKDKLGHFFFLLLFLNINQEQIN